MEMASEVQDMLGVMTKKFELQNDVMREQTEMIEKLKQKVEDMTLKHIETTKTLTSLQELLQDLVAEQDRLTQRASTQLKVMIELTQRWETSHSQ